MHGSQLAKALPQTPLPFARKLLYFDLKDEIVVLGFSHSEMTRELSHELIFHQICVPVGIDHLDDEFQKATFLHRRISQERLRCILNVEVDEFEVANPLINVGREIVRGGQEQVSEQSAGCLVLLPDHRPVAINRRNEQIGYHENSFTNLHQRHSCHGSSPTQSRQHDHWILVQLAIRSFSCFGNRKIAKKPSNIGPPDTNVIVWSPGSPKMGGRVTLAAMTALTLPARHAAPNRPANIRRSLFHMINGTVVLAFLGLAPEKVVIWTASCAFLTVWALEGTRRISPEWNARIMKLFAPVAHPHEYERINSGTWYVTALMVLAWVRQPTLGVAGVAVLTFADPAAGWFGRRFGRTKLLQNRTLEGSVVFVLVGIVAALAALVFVQRLPFASTGTMALGAGVSGALAEALSVGVDDNLTIPLIAAAGTAAAVALL